MKLTDNQVRLARAVFYDAQAEQGPGAFKDSLVELYQIFRTEEERRKDVEHRKDVERLRELEVEKMNIQNRISSRVARR